MSIIESDKDCYFKRNKKRFSIARKEICLEMEFELRLLCVYNLNCLHSFTKYKIRLMLMNSHEKL